MPYESTPTEAQIVVRQDGRDVWGAPKWDVILFENGKCWAFNTVVEGWFFERRLRKTQEALLRRYALVKKLSGPVFVHHG